MKKLPVLALFATSAMFASPMIAKADTTQYVETNHGWVSYHSGPRLSSSIVGRLELNQQAPLVGKYNSWWYEINVNGQDVYITTSSNYVHVAAGSATSTSSPASAPATTTQSSSAASASSEITIGEVFNIVSPTFLYYIPQAVASGEKANLWGGLQVQVTGIVNSDWMEVDVLNEGISGYITTSSASVQPATAASPSPAPAPAPTTTATSATSTTPSWQTQADAVIAIAKTQLGAPYYWGHQVPIGSVPAGQPYGFDCSNFVAWSYKTALGIHFSGASEYQRYNVGTPVPLDQIREGDLLFFKTSTNATGGGHVGLYMGNGQVIQCGGGWGKVTIENLSTTWLGRNLVYARRVIN